MEIYLAVLTALVWAAVWSYLHKQSKIRRQKLENLKQEVEIARNFLINILKEAEEEENLRYVYKPKKSKKDIISGTE